MEIPIRSYGKLSAGATYIHTVKIVEGWTTELACTHTHTHTLYTM